MAGNKIKNNKLRKFNLLIAALFFLQLVLICLRVRKRSLKEGKRSEQNGFFPLL
jgi:hypothetical protein